MDTQVIIKPLGQKAYGSIPHLPDSRLGPGDYALPPGQSALLTTLARDADDRIIVSEKLDGACVAIAKKDGDIIPLIRAGYHVLDSPHLHLQVFARWVAARQALFEGMLGEGERLVGEWLLLAHSIRYGVTHPDQLFVPFDLFERKKVKPLGEGRVLHDEFKKRMADAGLRPAHVISDGPPLSVKAALEALANAGYHNAIDPPEGAVWRLERAGKVEFLGKFVRADKEDGSLLPAVSGGEAVWNWPVGEL